MPTFTHTPTEKKVFFAHIPRTAGRYVDANFLWRNNFTWDEIHLDTGKGVMTDLHGAEIAHWHKDIYEEHLNVKDVPNFSIVRNPVDRFISAEGHISIVDSDLKDLDFNGVYKFNVNTKALSLITDQIDLPNLTVTQPNPSHVLDFRRFSSDQVVSFNRLQTDIIKSYSDAPIAHNFMGKTTEFDHFKVGDDLDIASWDSYPLGFLEDRVVAPDEFKQAFARQGDPDFQAFHHDLYRTVGKGRWWVMEQQPGPVNWAPYNPSPLPGMIRLWSWEAFAHGAEVVCYLSLIHI